MSKSNKGSAIYMGSFLAIATVFAACGSQEDLTSPLMVEGEELAAMLQTAIQDEYQAEAVYEGVLADFGTVTPFSNILQAEVRHSAAIAGLFASRGWAIPANGWSPSNVAHFESLAHACAAGVEAEIANVAVYDDLMARAHLPQDVDRVFSSNRSASLERHLPAFQRCAP